MDCPSCGAPSAGNFCSTCGESLASTRCPACGTDVVGGSRFCTGCGTSLGEGAPGSDPGKGGGQGTGAGRAGGKAGAPAGSGANPQNLGWWVAGALMIVTLVALGYPTLQRATGSGGAGMPPPGPAGATQGTSQVDLTTMPVQEQATVLFNRVMASASAGDSADVAFFLPKALVIHEQLNPTDPDGLYHFALLHLVGQDFEAALEKAQEGLVEIPDYLLLLAAAAEASHGLGNVDAAREHYEHFLRVYDAEMVIVRPGYEHHTQIFPAYRSEAEAYLAGG